MASLFGDPKNLPIECIHTNHQYPYAVRVVNKWLVQSGFRTDLKECSTEQSFRKYFGKNVRKLIYVNNPPSFNPGYRCKFLKTARLHSLQTVRYPLRQIENLHATDTKSWINSRYRGDHPRKGKSGFGRLHTYKRLKYISFESGRLDLRLNALRTLTNLQVLSITVHEDLFAKKYGIFLSIKSLKKLNLSVISLRSENPLTNQSEFPAFSNFLTDATKLKRLDFLGLKLTNLFDRIGPDSKSRFFESLNKIDIPTFNVELADLDIYCIDLQITHSCTNNIDLLELDLEKDVSVAIVCGNENITGNAKRKLKMSFKLKSPSSQNKMLSAIQAEANSSISEANRESQIDLNSKLEILAKDCLGIPFSLSEESNMKYLKSFSFNFARMVETASEEIDQALFNILKNENNLQHLGLQRDTGCCSIKSNVYQCFSIISQASALQNLTSLHLKDVSVQENFFEILSEVFRHLKNLKVLQLDLQTTDTIDDNIQAKPLLPVLENSKLTDVYLKLPQLKENVISDFIQIILGWHELEELTLASGNQLIEADKNRLALLDGFKKLKKLRKMSIFRETNGTKNSCFPFYMRNDHRNPIVAKVRSELKELYDLNPSLWKFCIESNEPPYQIRYKRY